MGTFLLIGSWWLTWNVLPLATVAYVWARRPVMKDNEEGILVSSRCFPRRLLVHCHQIQPRRGIWARCFNPQLLWCVCSCPQRDVCQLVWIIRHFLFPGAFLVWQITDELPSKLELGCLRLLHLKPAALCFPLSTSHQFFKMLLQRNAAREHFP